MNKEANIQHPTFNVQHRTPINSVFASTRHGRCCERALNSEPHVATATNDGGANLPVCPISPTASSTMLAEHGDMQEHRSARSCGSLGGASTYVSLQRDKAAPPYLGGGGDMLIISSTPAASSSIPARVVPNHGPDLRAWRGWR